MRQLFNRIPLILRYGVLLALGLIVLKTLEYQLFAYRFNHEVYTGLLALFFLLLGLSAGTAWLKGRQQAPEMPDPTQNVPLADHELLSHRERQLLKGLDQGMTYQQLADSEHLSINTVKTHLKSLYRKLGVSSRAEAVAKARRFDLLNRE